ncbi:MAG: helix-turn-helix domain-containing protein, partial [Defluviitaleaceae bacterium]|nr:helix-turn-helix domain-containing protein [Defluviitaleaceae bacterium]
MAVFRIDKTKNYTVMSNHHLRNPSLSLKAKGLLSQILSLPPEWDYTLKGLSHINRENVDAIRTAIQELERAGYVTRSRERKENGQLGGAEYIIHEQPPQGFTPNNPPPTSELPTLDAPILENPTQANPTLENPTQLNKDKATTEK